MSRAQIPWMGDAPPDLAHRPRCPGCDQPLKPRTQNLYDAGAVHPYARRWTGTWEAYDQLWHSMRCAVRFATMAHRAGYRRRKEASK